MTVAVCWKCGEIKWGAFNPCEKCKAAPASEDDLAVSIALSDHYLDESKLRRIGADIAAGHQTVLAQETRQQLITGLRASGLRRIAPKLFNVAREPTQAEEKTPWWRRIFGGT